MDLLYPPVIAVARGIFAVQGLTFTIHGEDHVPRTGGAVMAMNHIGYFDFTYAGLAAKRSRRLVRFMAKSELFEHPVGGRLLRGMHHINVDRSAGATSFRTAVSALRSGEIVGVFPEATISRSFDLKEFKSGAVRMAQDAGVPLLPTVIWGSQRVWTKGLPRHIGRTRTPIHVTVGEPMAAPADANTMELTQVLRTRMLSMLIDVQQAYPDRPTGSEDSWWMPASLGGTAPTPARAAELDEQARREAVRAYAARKKKERAKQAAKDDSSG